VNVPDSSYDAWAGGFTFPPGQSDGAADPESDSLVNAWEYLVGSDPLVSSTGVYPQSTVKSAAEIGLPGDKAYLTLQVRVRSRRLGTTIVPLAATTLAGLADADAVNHALQAGAPVPDGDYEIITYYHDVPIEDSPSGRGFIRLRIDQE
jgi:hypothetical protein